MTRPFCQNHILAFWKNWTSSQGPLDLALSNYFRSHKNLGSHDRRYIGDAIYTLVRWKSLFDCLEKEGSASKRLHLLQKQPVEQWTKEPFLPEWAKLGSSSFLYEKVIGAYGPLEGREILASMNGPAPTCIRANLMKTTREHLLELWKDRYQIRAGSLSSTAILFSKREPLFSLPEFKAGLFEVQDEGSQWIADLVEVKAGDRVLDYCSGSGGKSLAVAPKMGGKGELYLHDVRPRTLKEASERLRRAGVQNAQVLPPEHQTLKKLIGKMDWVLVDAPCSGSGTLRRNPDMKWKIDAAMLERLVEEQREIMKKAVSFLKPNGKIVYATCSLLPDENKRQVDFFLEHFPLRLSKEPLQLLPHRDGTDGFYAAVFIKETMK